MSEVEGVQQLYRIVYPDDQRRFGHAVEGVGFNVGEPRTWNATLGAIASAIRHGVRPVRVVRCPSTATCWSDS